MLSRALQLSVAAGTALVATALSAAAPGGWLQPPVNDVDLRLEANARRARIEDSSGRVERLSLGRGERLTALLGTESGWTATGIRTARAVDEVVDLVLYERRDGAPRRASLPGAQDRRLDRTGPAVAVASGERLGLAWLEGALGSPLAVRAAERTAEGWGPTVTVALPTAGSQTGLAATTLPNGDWLLVWSRFDGVDDELVWSRGRGTEWSQPRPVHPGNDQPDVTAGLRPTPSGALAVWSRRVDGEYRVLTAAFADGDWATPRVVSGPGGVYPRLAGSTHDPYASYLDARTDTWSLVDLDPTGKALRVARGLVTAGRPAITLAGGTARVHATAGAPVLPAWEPAP